jgi:hypothetical protein
MKWGSHPPGPGTKNPRKGNQDPILPAPDHATGSARLPRDPRIGRQETNRRGGAGRDLVDGRVHGVGADRALEQLVHPGGRRHQRPRPSAAVGGAGDEADRGRRGGGLEERARELRRRGGGAFVVLLLHAVGVGHALDAVQLHGPHQIEPDLRLPTREPPEKPLLLRRTTAKGMWDGMGGWNGSMERRRVVVMVGRRT